MNNVKKALLITIASDTTKFGGGFRGPFKQNYKYEYIPIPEYKTKADGKTFAHYYEGEEGDATFGKAPGNRLNKPLIESLHEAHREKLKSKAIHYDPDFKHKTYGDNPDNTRGKQVTELKPDDLLVFCPSLENYDGSCDRGRFIIGYFTVQQAYNFGKKDFEKEYKCTRKEIVEEYKNQNAHFSKAFARAQWKESQEDVLRRYSKKNKYLVLIVGQRCNSGLFEKAIRLTEQPKGAHAKDYYLMRQEIVKSLGLAKEPYRLHYGRGWKWVRGKHVENLLELFRKEGGGLHRAGQ